MWIIDPLAVFEMIWAVAKTPVPRVAKQKEPPLTGGALLEESRFGLSEL
jgi:hypothetical protein